MIQQALQQSHVTPEDAVYVGDRLTDILAANLAQVCSVAVKPIILPEKSTQHPLFIHQFQLTLEQILLKI